MSTPVIRRVAPRDAAALARLMGDPEVVGNLLQMPLANEELWRTRVADLCAPGSADLLLVAEFDGEVVGCAGLHPVNGGTRRRHTMMLGMAVVPAAQGRGVGKALLAALIDYADNWAQVLRLELNVFTDNERAIRLYTAFGFEREGLHRGHALRDGAYVDAYSMARWHPSPPSRQG